MNRKLCCLLALGAWACGGGGDGHDDKVTASEISAAEGSYNAEVKALCPKALKCFPVGADPDLPANLAYCEIPYHVSDGQEDSVALSEQTSSAGDECEKKLVAEHPAVYKEALECARAALSHLQNAFDSCPQAVPQAEEVANCFDMLEELPPPKGCEDE